MTEAATVYEYDIPAERPADTPRMTFKISGEPYRLIMPKLSVAVGLLSLMDREGEVPMTEYAMQLANSMWRLIDYVETEPSDPVTIPNPDFIPGAEPVLPETIANPNAGKIHGRALLQRRLNDPHDGLDITDLAPILGRVLAVMFNRPTGPLGASSEPPSSGDGLASAAVTPDQPAATS